MFYRSWSRASSLDVKITTEQQVVSSITWGYPTCRWCAMENPNRNRRHQVHSASHPHLAYIVPQFLCLQYRHLLLSHTECIAKPLKFEDGLKQLSSYKSIKKNAKLRSVRLAAYWVSLKKWRWTEALSRLQLSIHHPRYAQLLPTDLNYHIHVTPYGLICCTPSEAILGLNSISLLVLLAAWQLDTIIFNKHLGLISPLPQLPKKNPRDC